LLGDPASLIEPVATVAGQLLLGSPADLSAVLLALLANVALAIIEDAPGVPEVAARFPGECDTVKIDHDSHHSDPCDKPFPSGYHSYLSRARNMALTDSHGPQGRAIQARWSAVIAAWIHGLAVRS